MNWMVSTNLFWKNSENKERRHDFKLLKLTQLPLEGQNFVIRLSS